MTTRVSTRPLATPFVGHRPLLILAAVMAVSAAAIGLLAMLDPREVLGQNLWFKPLKFSISISAYALTLAWLITQVRRFRRVAVVGGNITAGALALEQVIIVGAAATGTTSHFNVSTALHTTLWAVMAASIATVWLIGLVVGVLLILSPGPDPARNLAIRAGVFIGLTGMAVAFLMTGPTSEQLNDFQGIAGAHAVGVPDGGAGLPFLGWSTEGGDLRVPHFVGMHALQALPLGLLALEWASARVPILRDPQVRLRLIRIAAIAVAGMLGLLTWQALAGQPVTAPAGAILGVGSALTLATVVAVAVVLARARP